jgi:hypothetical protein
MKAAKPTKAIGMKMGHYYPIYLCALLLYPFYQFIRSAVVGGGVKYQCLATIYVHKPIAGYPAPLIVYQKRAVQVSMCRYLLHLQKGRAVKCMFSQHSTTCK